MKILTLLFLMVFGNAVSQKPFVKIGVNTKIGFASSNENEFSNQSFNNNPNFIYETDRFITKSLKNPSISIALGYNFKNESSLEIGYSLDNATCAYRIYSKSYFEPFNNYSTAFMYSYSAIKYNRLFLDYLLPIGDRGQFVSFGVQAGFYGKGDLTSSSSFGANIDSNLVYEFKTTDIKPLNSKIYLSLGFVQCIKWHGKKLFNLHCFYNFPIGRYSTFKRLTNVHDINDANAPSYSYTSLSKGAGVYFSISKDLSWGFWKKESK